MRYRCDVWPTAKRWRHHWPGVSAWFIKKEADRAVRKAEGIRNHYLDRLQASNVINTFQWSKVRLALEHPEALAHVQRFEATGTLRNLWSSF